MTTPTNHNPQTDEDEVIQTFEACLYVLALFSLVAIATALWYGR